MPTAKKTIYADLFNNMDIHPISDDIALKTNENAIKQSIRNLLLTDRGERPFYPNLGSDIRALLFEHFTPQTLTVMKEKIRETIENFEPRCSIVDIVIAPDDDRNSVFVSISFAVINRQEPITLELILDRVR